MPFVSFAPNCEDVPLWRALCDIEQGQYVDWGPEPADGASFTQAFYDRGWSGIAVRPSAEQAAALAASRPRDRVLAAGQTLLLEGALHFMRADGVALSQLDLTALRPWIVIVPHDDPAAEALAQAGYNSVLFDGLNRFYLSPERDALAARLAAPANSADGFVRSRDATLAAQLERAQALLVVAEARVEDRQHRAVEALRSAGHAQAEARREVEWLRGQVAHRLTEAAARLEETRWLRECLHESELKIAWFDGQTRELSARLEELAAQGRHAEAEALSTRDTSRSPQSSAFRRLTAPLRRIGGVAAPPAQSTTPPRDAAAASRAAMPMAPVATRPMPASPVPAPLSVPEDGRTLSPPPSAISSGAAGPEATEPTRSILAPVQSGPKLNVVHQFHAGSARGDAITNAMFLIRTRLRAAGFRSDIFVEARGEGLEHEIRLIDELPDHPYYILLLHHSMGYENFDSVVALPARKILIYHNITPAEHFSGHPALQQHARLGRDQLVALRDHVVFALADSPFNAFELHRLGFPAVRTCTLLFDAAMIAQRNTGPHSPTNMFTVLFVGRVTPSKAQDNLIEAFAVFRARLGRPCRLVLVGHTDVNQFKYLDHLMTRIAALELTEAVYLTGAVSDEELQDWYRTADLYVSLSRHEGFCVPLVEALAYSLPVLARAAGAVPFTLGDDGVLLETGAPEAVADAMLAAALRGRPDTAAAIARWSVDAQWPVLATALAAAGAMELFDPALRSAAARRLLVTVTGHVAGTYSLAAVNRTIAALMEAHRPGSVRIRPFEGASTDDVSGVPEAERPAIAALVGRSAPESGPELVLSGHYPVHVPAERGDVTAAVFFWEETLIPAETVELLNRNFDAVFAPSRFVATTLVDSGVKVPVLNFGLAPRLEAYGALFPRERRSERFTFLHVSSAFPRKGVDALLAAWAKAFTHDDAVRLVIKTFPNPHNDAAALCARLRADYPAAAPVVLVDEDLPADEMLGLYREADAAVLPTRGEGYNLAAAEAMAAGLPLIVSARGGHRDFCSSDTARLVRCRLEPSTSHLARGHALWAEPDIADLTASLREAAAGSLAKLAGPAHAVITVATDPAAFAARLADAAASVLLAPPMRPIRLAWVSSWAVRCGIAEYSRTLIDGLPRDDMAHPVILADDRTEAGPNVRPSWRAGDASSADRLAAAIARVDGHVTVIQHQPGLLPWGGLARLLDQLAGQDRVVVVTLHNTRDLADTAPADRAEAVRALGRVARVLVHTVADLHELDAHGLSGSVTLFPHPAPAPARATIRLLPPDSTPVIGCTGFFLPDKGIAQLIAAVVRLRRRWPGVRLRLVNAEHDDPSSAAAIAECRALADAESLAVEWHTGFVTLEAQRALLAGCDLLVLPYQRSKEGSSAALRSALGTGIPVAVTPLPLFAEAEGAVFRMSGLDPDALEEGMAALLADPERRVAIATGARAWVAGRAAPDVAKRLGGMLAGLAAQHRLGAPLDGALWPGGSR